MNLDRILEINKKLKEPFKKLSFVEDTHTYSVEGIDKPIKSVSSLLKYFYDEFDSKNISYGYAKSWGLERDQVLLAWEGSGTIATTHGTKVHLFAEDYIKWKYFGIGNKPQVFDKQSLGAMQFVDDLPDYLVPVATELQMYDEDNWYCGTCDIVLNNTKTNKLIIADWKGLPLDTPILTDSGWKTMGSLSLSDRVFDKDGKLVDIKHISNIKNKKCLKIKFDNNDEVVSDFEHRWLVHVGCTKGEREVVMTTQEIYDYNNKISNNRKHRNILRIKNAKPLDLPERDLPIDPYVLGNWLGDGHSADGKITHGNSKIWEEIKKRGYRLGEDLNKCYNENAQRRTVFGIYPKLRELNLLGNKHIPEIYLLSSFSQRLDLLRGFMDADGYYDKVRKRFITVTTRKSQADYIVEILATLGIKSTTIPFIARWNDKQKQAWRVSFTTKEFNPFLNRNQDISIGLTRRSLYRYISTVEEVESVPTICIEVDSPSSTFLFGKSLCVTHNTNNSLFDELKKPLKIIDSNLVQDNFGKYSLQFSFYSLLLQLTGYEVSNRVLVWLDEDKPNKKLYKTYRTQDLTKQLEEWLKRKEHTS